MNLQQLQNRIAEEASRNNGEVLVGVLEKLKYVHIRTAHLRWCDCEFCEALRKYTLIKRSLHRRAKQLYAEALDTDDFFTNSFRGIDAFRDKLVAIKQIAKEAKREKDSFKDLHI